MRRLGTRADTAPRQRRGAPGGHALDGSRIEWASAVGGHPPVGAAPRWVRRRVGTRPGEGRVGRRASVGMGRVGTRADSAPDGGCGATGEHARRGHPPVGATPPGGRRAECGASVQLGSRALGAPRRWARRGGTSGVGARRWAWHLGMAPGQWRLGGRAEWARAGLGTHADCPPAGGRGAPVGTRPVGTRGVDTRLAGTRPVSAEWARSGRGVGAEWARSGRGVGAGATPAGASARWANVRRVGEWLLGAITPRRAESGGG